MTVKKRLFWSNILMILVPVMITILIGLGCIGFIWLALINGAGFGLRDAADFSRASLAISEVIEKQLTLGIDFSALDGLLDANGMRMEIWQDGKSLYVHGEVGEQDPALTQAASALGNDTTITHAGRSLYAHKEQANGLDYQIYLFGGSSDVRTYTSLKIALAISAAVILFTIFVSIFLTNRFLTRFVFRKIEEPLEVLTGGVHEIRDGNLNFRIDYTRQDEFLPVCQDFNEMAQRLQNSVAQIQQQERSRKELIAGISHDIRSPLTSILAYVEGLLDGVAKTPEAQRKYLEIIHAKAKDLEHIVSQLFLFSKMELGECPENRRFLALDETIENSVAAAQDEYRQKGLAVKTRLEPVSMQADPVQVQRIVTNLLENSLKYKDKPIGNLEITLKRTNAGCSLSFADDGPGVPSEALPHLFEVFYRSDPARQNPHQGSGLGLAIVAQAVRQMSGTVTAQPSVSGGLEIRIDFPKEVLSDG